MKEFYNKTKIIYGRNALERLYSELYYYKCTRLFVITDEYSVFSGIINRVRKLLSSNNLEITYVTIQNSIKVDTQCVKLAYEQCRASNSDFILCIGSDVVASIGKAVKLLIDEGVNDLEKISKISDNDVVKLLFLPTDIDNMTFSTGKIAVYDVFNNKIFRFNCDKLTPSFIIIDNRIIKKISSEKFFSKISVILGLSIITLMQDNIPISAKVLADTALDIIQVQLKCSNQVLPYDKLLVSQVYSSIAYGYVRDKLLSSILFNIYVHTDLDYNQIFSSIYPKYLKVFFNTPKYELADYLATLYSKDHYAELDSKAKYNYICDSIMYSIYFCLSKCNNKGLGSLGMNHNQIEDIVNSIIIENGLKDNYEKTMLIKKVIGESYSLNYYIEKE